MCLKQTKHLQNSAFLYFYLETRVVNCIKDKTNSFGDWIKKV